MNTRHLLPALLLAAAPWLSGSALAAVPPVDGVGAAASTSCPTLAQRPTILHFDKIVFAITNKLIAALPADQAKLSSLPLNTELDIKIIDKPTTVADLKGKVLTFLGANTSAANRALIRIISVDYEATLCPKSP